MQNLTSQQLIQTASKHIDELDAELLLAHILCRPREYIIAHLSESVSRRPAARFRRLVKKRAAGVPLAYLTGHKEFFGLDFIVNKDVLIPRPETETMVEAVINRLQTTDYRLQTVLIDIGTGSGCIPISIGRHIRKSGLSGYPDIIATDISRRALRVAKQNAARHGVDIAFFRGNLLQPLFKTLQLYNSTTLQLIITANLPYLTESQYQSAPSIQFEPKLALIAQADGLALYEKLLKQIQSLISNFQFPVSLFFEIDPSQAPRITALIKHLLPEAGIKIKPDLAGRERVVVINMTRDS